MKFRNKETGEIYDRWNDILCDGKCWNCPASFDNNKYKTSNQNTMKIKLDENAIMPTRAHDIDAGLDLYATCEQVITGFGSAVFDTGVHVEIPVGYAGMVKSKSGLNVKHNLTSEGVVDAGYTGSILVKLYNHSSDEYIVRRGDKISQLVIVPIITPALEVVDELEETERGISGFGSTGR